MTGEFLNLGMAASVLAPFGGDQCDFAGREKRRYRLGPWCRPTPDWWPSCGKTQKTTAGGYETAMETS